MRRSLCSRFLALGCLLIVGAAMVRHLHGRRHYRPQPRETMSRPVVSGPGGGTGASGPSVTSAAPVTLARARDGVLIWEAEHANRLTGTFAVLPSQDCSGGLALWCREGQGKNNTTTYSPPGGRVDQGIVDYFLNIPRSGDYRLFMRLWAMDQCGNSAWIGMDTDTALTYFPGGQHGPHGADNYIWPEVMYRRWLWIDDEGTTYHLAKGPHRLRIEVREDGVGFDEIALVPVGTPDPSGIRPPTLLPGAGKWPAGTAPARDRMSTRETNAPTPFDAFLAVENRALCPAGRPAVSGWVTMRLNARKPADVRVRLAAGDALFQPAPELRVRLKPGAPFACIPFRAEFPTGEGLGTLDLTATATSAAAPALVVRRTCRLVYPLEWWAVGPFRGEEDQQAGQELADARDVNPERELLGRQWTRVEAPQHYDAFGAVDLNRLFGRQESCAAYLATRIYVARSGDYVLHAGGDDTLKLRLDGQTIVDEAFEHPLTDTAGPHPLHLDAGEHLLVARVAQKERYWQMIAEFLDAAGRPTADVVGIPLR